MIGEDQWDQFSTWHQSSYLLKNYKILVGRRQLKTPVKNNKKNHLNQPIYLENSLFNCASSILKTKNTSHWIGKVPSCVLNYILKHQLNKKWCGY